MVDPIYQPKGLAREYGDLAINIYNGCTNACTYCYAPLILRKKKEVFHASATPKHDIVERVAAQLAKGKIKGKTIHLCFTCDPYPAEVDTTVTREIIFAIKGSGNNVQILTKSGETRDLDLLGINDSYGVTLTCGGTEREKHEPNAANLNARFEGLLLAKRNGLKTWVSCEPVINESFAYEIIKSLSSVDHFAFGAMNHFPGWQDDINWEEFSIKVGNLCRKHDKTYTLKSSILNKIKKERGK